MLFIIKPLNNRLIGKCNESEKNGKGVVSAKLAGMPGNYCSGNCREIRWEYAGSSLGWNELARLHLDRRFDEHTRYGPDGTRYNLHGGAASLFNRVRETEKLCPHPRSQIGKLHSKLNQTNIM
jgi:hypothetical protein